MAEEKIHAWTPDMEKNTELFASIVGDEIESSLNMRVRIGETDEYLEFGVNVVLLFEFWIRNACMSSVLFSAAYLTRKFFDRIGAKA